MTDGRSQLKTIGSRVFYRDKIEDYFDYVEGVVTDCKSVEDAERDWDQQWSHKYGYILEITPVEAVEEKRKKYRHLSSVLTPEQYITWAKNKLVWARRYERRLSSQIAHQTETDKTAA